MIKYCLAERRYKGGRWHRTSVSVHAKECVFHLPLSEPTLKSVLSVTKYNGGLLSP